MKLSVSDTNHTSEIAFERFLFDGCVRHNHEASRALMRRCDRFRLRTCKHIWLVTPFIFRIWIHNDTIVINMSDVEGLEGWSTKLLFTGSNCVGSTLVRTMRKS